MNPSDPLANYSPNAILPEKTLPSSNSTLKIGALVVSIVLLVLILTQTSLLASLLPKKSSPTKLVNESRQVSAEVSQARLVSAVTTGTLIPTTGPTVPVLVPTSSINPTKIQLTFFKTMYKDGVMLSSWSTGSSVRYDCQDQIGRAVSGVVSLQIGQPVTITTAALPVGPSGYDCTFEEFLPQAPGGSTWLKSWITKSYSSDNAWQVYVVSRLITIGTPPTVTPTRPPVTPTGIASTIMPTQPPVSTPTGVASKRVFVTFNSYYPDFGGVAGADSKCQASASSVGLTGTWKAWLSDATSSPLMGFVKHNGPYTLIDGTLIANNWNDLVDGQLNHGIYMTEKGGNYTTQVWSDTKIDGSAKATEGNATCNQWTGRSVYAHTYSGQTTGTNSSWTDDAYMSCDVALHLFCFEQ